MKEKKTMNEDEMGETGRNIKGKEADVTLEKEDWALGVT
jgi:hypothetical protein